MASKDVRDGNLRGKDIRDTALYRESEALFAALRQPGTGQISDAVEIHAAPDAKTAVFAGSLAERAEGPIRTRICSVDVTTGDLRVLTFGPHTDRSPKFSPDGRQVAFLSDRHKAGSFQLYLLDLACGAARPTAHVPGWVEFLQWSPDGTRVLLGVAGHGADVSGGQGAISSARADEQTPSWMPEVDANEDTFRWRHAWIYELATGRVNEIPAAECNVWEAAWCGNDAIVAVVSTGPGEGLWYDARLHLIDVTSGSTREIYRPRHQVGLPTASADGTQIAVIDALCSDRGIVAGALHLVDRHSGKVRQVDCRGVDVGYTEWRGERHLLLGGHRDFETVVGLYDTHADVFTELWRSEEMTAGGRYATVTGLAELGDFVLVGERPLEGPQIAVVRNGDYRAIKDLGLPAADRVKPEATLERVKWRAPDGLEIQGWLLRPQSAGPHPLVMQVHGGPVFHWRPRWLGRSCLGLTAMMLLKRGYAMFFPNPRGSSGRGLDFARGVLGEMGGADTQDCLAGVEHLVSQGIADPKRLGVTGGSYGGFMTAWLVTQDTRFAAAVAVAPISNHVTEHLLSNIPHFVKLFLADDYTQPGGKYFQRSPIMHARNVKTPTMSVCGALDRCTPPQEAMQFHNALIENGVTSVLVSYPQEGHGIRKYPAALDCAARMVGWFEEHMPSVTR